MKRSRVALSALAITGVLVISGCSSSSKSSSATTTTSASGGVKVTTPVGATTLTIVAGDTKGTNGPMTYKMSATTVPAGKVTILLKNTGTIQHEAVVLKTDTAFDKLKVGADNKVSESTTVGEVSETDAGKTKSSTLDLKPGNYVIVCNIAKHYAMGMRAALVVT